MIHSLEISSSITEKNPQCAVAGYKCNCSNIIRAMPSNANDLILKTNPQLKSLAPLSTLCTTHYANLLEKLTYKTSCILRPTDCIIHKQKKDETKAATKDLRRHILPKFGLLDVTIPGKPFRIHSDCFNHYMLASEEELNHLKSHWIQHDSNAQDLKSEYDSMNIEEKEEEDIVTHVEEQEIETIEEKDVEEDESAPSTTKLVAIPELCFIVCGYNTNKEWTIPLTREYLGPLDNKLKPNVEYKMDFDVNGFVLIPSNYSTERLYDSERNKIKYPLIQQFMKHIKTFRTFHLEHSEFVRLKHDFYRKIAKGSNIQLRELLCGWEFVFNGEFWQRQINDIPFYNACRNYATSVLVRVGIKSRDEADALIMNNFKAVLLTNRSKSQFPHMDSVHYNAMQVIIYTAPSVSTQFAKLTQNKDGQLVTGAEQWKHLYYYKVQSGDMVIFRGTVVHAGSGAEEAKGKDVDENRLIIFFTLHEEEYSDNEPVSRDYFRGLVKEAYKELESNKMEESLEKH